MKILLVFFSFFIFPFFFCNAQFSIWGVAATGGIHNKGVIFKYTPSSGTFSKIFDFGGTCSYDTLDLYDTTGAGPNGLLLANNGNIYGNTAGGGSCYWCQFWGYGTFFSFNPSSGNFSNLVTFGTDCGSMLWGYEPLASQIQASDGNIYGTQYTGGQCSGCFYKYNIDSSKYYVIENFGCYDGMPGSQAKLFEASDGKLYGILISGPGVNQGEIYKYDPLTNAFNYITYSNYFGKSPEGSFIEGDTGKLYAFGKWGGLYGYGTIFDYDYINNIFSKKHDFDSINDGCHPTGNLIKASDGYLYGLTPSGGQYGYGTFFRFDIQADTLIKIIDFDQANNGSNPWGNIIQSSNGKIYGTTQLGGFYNKGVLFEYDIANNIFVKIFDFNSVNGSIPRYLIEVPDSLVLVTEFLVKNININVYPNPSEGNFTIETQQNNILEIEILDLLGRILLKEKTKKSINYFSISEPPGLYIIRIKTTDGCILRKLIIEQ